jgi:hypothetical protein
MRDVKRQIVLYSNGNMDVDLQGSIMSLKRVVISAQKISNVRGTQMGVQKLDIKTVKQVPVVFGEADVLRVVTLLPGVKTVGEASTGLNVRGGSSDQNLILFNDATIYNPAHFFGMFSAFNPELINNVELYKSTIPANFGGRLASVLDISSKEGNKKEVTGSAGIGLLTSRVNIEGPIEKNKSSFILSGRRTYADVFLKATEKFKDNILYFYDLNAKANYQINAKNKVYISGYFGRDELGLGQDFGIDWGNKTGTVRWNKIISNKLFLNTSFIYSDYNYNVKLKNGETNFNINSEIKDVNLKQDYTFYANNQNTLRFGFNTILHNIKPSTFSGTVINSVAKSGRNGLENALYLTNNYKATNQLTIDYGMRLSMYTLMGGDVYNMYENGVVRSSIKLSPSSFGKTYAKIKSRCFCGFCILLLENTKI